MTEEHPGFTAAAMEGIRNLLQSGQEYGIGITFEPDPGESRGWRIGYMHGMGGGDLASAYDLETAVKAAERPLDELFMKLEESGTP